MKRIRIFALVFCCMLLCFALSGCNETTNSDTTQLSPKKEQEIKKAYVKLVKKVCPNKEYSVDNIWIDYYGTFNGAIVVLMEPNLGEGSDEPAVGYIYIDKYYIATPVENLLVHVYKNGKFTEITEAYEKGMLTKQDIAEMADGIVTEDGERIPKEFITPNPTN